MREAIKILNAYANKVGRFGSDVFVDFLDYLLEMFDYRHFLTDGGFETNSAKMYQENPDFMTAALIWLEKVTLKIERLVNWDGLGAIYEEMYKSKGKADVLGQFFTPDCLCELMAKIAYDDTQREQKVNDSACGSGRTLIAARVMEMRNGENSNFYYGEDIDAVAAKMAALNLMIYGCKGMVTRMDTLQYQGTWDCYVLNEVRYPFPTPFYSIRKAKRVIPAPETNQQKPTAHKAERPVQLTLF